MEILILGLLLVLGIILILIETLFIPGTTIFGILGIIAIFSSDYLSYVYFGTEFAIIYSIINSVVCLGIIIYSLKSNTWDRISLKKDLLKNLRQIKQNKLLKKRAIGILVCFS